VGTPGTVPRPSLLALSAGADLQPSMAPPAATVVVASERPMAAPRRRGRPQPRSLGLVVTLGQPLGTASLQTGPSVAREASFHLVESTGAQRTYRVWAFVHKCRNKFGKYSGEVGRAPWVHLPTGRAGSAAPSASARHFF